MSRRERFRRADYCGPGRHCNATSHRSSHYQLVGVARVLKARVLREPGQILRSSRSGDLWVSYIEIDLRDLLRATTRHRHAVVLRIQSGWIADNHRVIERVGVEAEA